MGRDTGVTDKGAMGRDAEGTSLLLLILFKSTLIDLENIHFSYITIF